MERRAVYFNFNILALPRAQYKLQHIMLLNYYYYSVLKEEYVVD